MRKISATERLLMPQYLHILDRRDRNRWLRGFAAGRAGGADYRRVRAGVDAGSWCWIGYLAGRRITASAGSTATAARR